MGPARFPQRIVRFLEHGSLSEPAAGRPLAFIHINKTAGTTFTEFLRGHFDESSDVAPPFFGKFDDIGIQDEAKQLYWGHFPYARFIQHRPEALFITFLRDPVQRVVSQYRSLHNPANVGGGWEKVLPTSARVALEFAQQATFEEFVFSEDPFIVGHLKDLQTQFLTSHLDHDHPEFLSSAMTNLVNRVLFFGTTEAFEDSVKLFQFQLGSQCEYASVEQRRNVSQPYPVDISDRARGRIEILVRNDLELYQHAVTVLNRRFQVLRQLDGTVSTNRAA